jgi:class 3 adenylate cyclase
MSAVSVPSLITGVFFLFLGIAVITYNPREKVNVILGILAFNWMLFTLSSFAFHQSGTAAEASFWNKWPYMLLLPSMILTMYYTIVLSRLDAQWDRRIFYLPIRTQFGVFVLITALFWIIVILTDLLIAPPMRFPLTGYEHSYGPFIFPFNAYCIYALILIFGISRQGVRTAANTIERHKIRFSSIGLVIGLSAAYLVGVVFPIFHLQTHSLATIPFAFISMCFIYALIKYQYLEIQEKMEEIDRTSRLKRYLSPQVVEAIVSGREKDLALKNERREVSIFFSDLRGFTRFSDEVEPEEVMQLLKSYHAEMGNFIFQYNGTLERFAGDGIMVIFGAPIPYEDHALRAVKMALEMKGKVKELQREWERKDYRLDLGMGLCTGYATVGSVGFEGRMDYTAIGKVTNLAARLCEEAKGGQILMNKNTYLCVEKQVNAQEIGNRQYKGFARPVATFEVIGLQ